MRINKPSILSASIATLLLAVAPAHAVNFTWNGGGADDNWTTGNNWGGTASTTASGADLIFSGNARNSPVNDNTGNFVVGSSGAGLSSINFTNDGTGGKTNAFTLSGVSGSTLDIKAGGTGGGQSIISTASSSLITDTISANLSLSANMGISTGTLHNLTISGTLVNASGTRTLTKTGLGELTLTNSGNSYAGITTLNQGILTVNVVGAGIGNVGPGNTALGAPTTAANGQLNFSAGSLNFASGAASSDRQVRIGNTTVTSAGGATITNNGTNGSTPLVFSNAAFNVSAGAITAARTITLGGANTDANTISGAIIDNNTVGGGIVNVTKADAGTWTLAGTNSYTGTTIVSGGKLQVTGVIGSGAVNVSGGTTTSMTGTGSVGGAVTVTASSRLAPGVNTSGVNGNFGVAGTLTLGTTGGLALTSANLDFDLASTAAGVNDKIVTGGALSLGSTIAFTFNELTPGTLETGVAYNLITGATNVIGSTSGITATFIGGNYTPTFGLSGNDLQVTFAAVPEPGTYVMALGGLGMFALLRRRRLN